MFVFAQQKGKLEERSCASPAPPVLWLQHSCLPSAPFLRRHLPGFPSRGTAAGLGGCAGFGGPAFLHLTARASALTPPLPESCVPALLSPPRVRLRENLGNQVKTTKAREKAEMGAGVALAGPRDAGTRGPSLTSLGSQSQTSKVGFRRASMVSGESRYWKGQEVG